MVAMQWIPLAALKPNPRNARTHSRKQIRQIADSITAFGFLVPILIDVIVKGDPQFEYQYAGHVENGEASISDPGMGGLI